ncbi:MAG: hypothetical protein WDW38_003739 [Sanguina aurantia]
MSGPRDSRMARRIAAAVGVPRVFDWWVRAARKRYALLTLSHCHALEASFDTPPSFRARETPGRGNTWRVPG